MFLLDTEAPIAPQQVKVKFLSSGIGPQEGQPLQLCQVGEAIVGVPASDRESYLPDVDEIISHVGPNKSGVLVSPVADLNSGKRFIVGGCDPATTILGAQIGGLDLK